MIRLALIGTGPWGRNYVHSALEAGNCKVTHVAGDPRGRSDLTSLKVVGSREWRLLLDAPVDAFIVATPPDTHWQIAHTILRAGRPVMVEKPFALAHEDAESMVRASKESGVPLLVNHQHLFAPAYEELLRMVCGWGWHSIESYGGGIGPVRSYSALWDYGPHDVAMFMGVARNRMSNSWVTNATKDGGSFSVSLRTQLSYGSIQVWNDRGPKTRLFSVRGDAGVLVYNDMHEQEKLWFNGEPVSGPFAGDSDRPLARAMRAFAEAVTYGLQSFDYRMKPKFTLDVARVLSDTEDLLSRAAA